MRTVLVGFNEMTGESGRTQFVDFAGFELGYIHCSDVVTEPMAIIMSAFMGPDLVPPLALTLSYKQDTDKPKVEIAGCDKKMPEAAGLIKKAGQALGTTTPEGGKR
jgi:hypothetical protein